MFGIYFILSYVYINEHRQFSQRKDFPLENACRLGLFIKI